jgi:hypothetical protein
MRLDLSALSPSLTNLSFSEPSLNERTSFHYREHGRNNFSTPMPIGYDDIARSSISTNGTGRSQANLVQRQLSHLRSTGNNEMELEPEDAFLADDDLLDDDHEGVAFTTSQVFVQIIGNFLGSLRENPGVHFLVRASLFF